MSIQCGTHTQKFHTGAHKRVAKTDNRCLKQFRGGCDMHDEVDEICQSLSDEEGHDYTSTANSHLKMILTCHR